MAQLYASGYILKKVQASVQHLIPMFIAALFTIAMAQNRRITGCCSGVKNKIMLFAEKLMEPENHQVKQNKPGFERQIVHVFPHMWNMDFFF